MGWSCSKAAGNVTDSWQKKCRLSTGSANTFVVKRVKYFFDISSEEYDDGSITGELLMCLTQDRCRKIGNFRIDGKGTLVEAPDVLKNFMA